MLAIVPLRWLLKIENHKLKNMNKLNWKYDKLRKQWYTLESKPYAMDSALIEKTKGGEFYLQMDYPQFHLRFKKLNNAKKVAQLITNG